MINTNVTGSTDLFYIVSTLLKEFNAKAILTANNSLEG